MESSLYSFHWSEAFWGNQKQSQESLCSKWTISYHCGESCSSNMISEGKSSNVKQRTPKEKGVKPPRRQLKMTKTPKESSLYSLHWSEAFGETQSKAMRAYAQSGQYHTIVKSRVCLTILTLDRSTLKQITKS